MKFPFSLAYHVVMSRHEKGNELRFSRSTLLFFFGLRKEMLELYFCYDCSESHPLNYFSFSLSFCFIKPYFMRNFIGTTNRAQFMYVSLYYWMWFQVTGKKSSSFKFNTVTSAPRQYSTLMMSVYKKKSKEKQGRIHGQYQSRTGGHWAGAEMRVFTLWNSITTDRPTDGHSLLWSLVRD